MKHTLIVILSLIGFHIGLQAQAQSIAMHPAQEVIKPRLTGQTMNHIIQTLGEPQQRLHPIGEPAITRWQYSDQTLYFEQEQVIHSVQHKDFNSIDAAQDL